MASEILLSSIPNLDEPLVKYISSTIDDPPNDLEDFQSILPTIVQPILESYLFNQPSTSKNTLPTLLEKLSSLLQKNAPPGLFSGDSTVAAGLTRLERVVDMRNTSLSKTAGFDQAGGVDIGLGGSSAPRSTVDVKALAKQEAKTRAKLQKRAQRDLYESSKLVESSQKMASYEEMFLKVNPLETAGARGKNKDIHLPSIDVNFGSNRILSNASLTLASGRR